MAAKMAKSMKNEHETY